VRLEAWYGSIRGFESGIGVIHHVAVEGIETARAQDVVQSTELLPFDYRKRRIESVQVGNLDVVRVVVVCVTVSKGDALANMIVFFGCSCGDAQHAKEDTVNKIDPHTRRIQWYSVEKPP
jgi:hypothetical protein